MKEVLEFVAQQLVDEPDEVEVEEIPGDRGVMLRLKVAPDDMGKVIGKGGRTARAIRTLMKTAAAREGLHARVDIVEE
ncbi:MAG: KH domain-containing protein [Actinomycetota bacterium]